MSSHTFALRWLPFASGPFVTKSLSTPSSPSSLSAIASQCPPSSYHLCTARTIPPPSGLRQHLRHQPLRLLFFRFPQFLSVMLLPSLLRDHSQPLLPEILRPPHHPRLNRFPSSPSLLISNSFRCSIPCSNCRRPAALSSFTPHSQLSRHPQTLSKPTKHINSHLRPLYDPFTSPTPFCADVLGCETQFFTVSFWFAFSGGSD
jgi:hypothetical protein